MPAYNLLDLSSILRSFGRGVVFYAADRWDPALGPALAMTHLGDTEGDITVATNPQVDALTTPELTGPAPHELDYSGEAPTIELPLYLTDPALYAVVTPTDNKSGGRSRRSASKERTLCIFPEELFLTGAAGSSPVARELSYSGAAWTVNAIAATAAQLAWIDQSMWFWRVVFNRPPRTFHGGAGDARKQIETVSAMVLHHGDMPEDHHLYTIGDPGTQSPDAIDIEGGS